MIQIEGELRKILQDVCDYNWSLYETTDGGHICFAEHMGSFGDPDDKLWDMIVASEFPIYLRADSYDNDNPVEVRLCDPSEIKWVHNSELYIAYYDADGTIHNGTGVGIYLGEKENAPDRIIFDPKGLGIISLGKFIIEQYMNAHETVDKKFVQAIINWMI